MSKQEQEQSVSVELPDGSVLEFDEPPTISAVAHEIGPGLGEDCRAGRVDGDLVSPKYTIDDDATLEIVTPGSDDYIHLVRHSAAHVFAQALQRCYPEATLAIGPWTDDGFYYDVAGADLDEDDFEEIEAEMAAIVEADYAIERVLRSREDALEIYEDNPYKRDILESEAAGEDPISFYVQDGWQDLCKGPHVESTGEIGAVKLLQISSAYWRGEEDNEMLTRVYGTAFESESELEAFLERRRKAQERDHRKIGQELNLFSLDEMTGPGLPLYHPNGKTVLNELSAYVATRNREAGYREVETPHVFRTDLWKKSGHYDNYREDMFLLEVNDEEYALKPMNCPGHATIFDQQQWSYRDLPVRYFEDGKVYRKEQRGELSGLSRVWAFTIDDGHLFVRPDQIDDEVEAIMDIILEILNTFDLEFTVQFATRPVDSVGSDEIWERAESQLEAVLEAADLEYVVEEGDGAFYGPKIDFAFEDALGRDWDGPTVQLDFNMPERFDLSYVGQDNEEHRPVMIHRALYGSYERFFMVLTEHYNGKFPPWLAPEQIRILPISDDQFDYARQIKNRYLGDYRVSIEDRSWTIKRKIRAAHEDRVPYQLIVGSDEAEAGTISIRDRKEQERNDVDPETFADHLDTELRQRRTDVTFVDSHRD